MLQLHWQAFGALCKVSISKQVQTVPIHPILRYILYMMASVYKVDWDESNMNKALEEIRKGSLSFRKASLKYNIPVSTLSSRTKALNVPTGRKQTLSSTTEDSIAKCLHVLCNCGFSPSVEEFLDLVQCHLNRSGITNAFKNNRPGRHWLSNFMERNNLSLKKANVISKARKAATSNPFIIYDFYDLLEDVVTSKALTPCQIWNCDESGFPSDPASCRVVGTRGAVSYKVTSGPGRNNTTVLAACSAAGEAFPPMIVFQGMKFQSTWKGNDFYM